MKMAKTLARLASLMLVGMLLLGIWPIGVAAEALLANGSFETTDIAGLPEGWTLMGTAGAANVVAGTTEAPAKDGTKYMKLTTPNDGVKLVYTGEKGYTYKLSVWYKATITDLTQVEASKQAAYGRGAASINMYDSNGRSAAFQNVATGVLTVIEKSEVWKQATILMRIAKGCTSGDITVELTNIIANMTVCYDAVELTRLDGYENRNMIVYGDFESDTAQNSAEAVNIINWTGTSGSVRDNQRVGEKVLSHRQRSQVYTQVMIDSSEDTVRNTYDSTYRFSGWVKETSVGAGGYLAPTLRFLTYKTNPDRSLSGATDGTLMTLTEGFTVTDSMYVALPLTAANTWEFITFDFKLPKTTDIVRLGLFAGSGWTSWDDLSIVPVQTSVDVMDGDGKILKEVPGATATTLSARGRYTGTSSNATMYLAIYEKESGDAIVLKHVALVTVPNDGNYYTCQVENADTSGEGAYVKVFLWDGMDPVINTVTLSRATAS